MFYTPISCKTTIIDTKKEQKNLFAKKLHNIFSYSERNNYD
ncbi:hypothetical protein EfmE980_2529 [Enterococcus faecium E980]|uniref:Uncharacterized protein n=2 Tax=Enterococcus faecium TaxID=1352 RepID=J6KBV3_ENTFC|nr:hypothetical protein EfmE980_2529 [Enterococcus faecium E980]EJY46008.1 hypothetical protein HMPREF1348_01113 [Enterococcus faecium 505]EPI14377.1 hypothetical protein D356_00760 [Enterococcus faecium SD2A-2]KXA09592.1 hypothetical protein HMPREF3199_01073 [Enterococcus faecium]MBL4989102.1 hypothetical protein [Enterococcus lactis]